ncbi:hypothetical protein FTO60_04245 [Octadecabacter sp. SW4]|uniref:hypothetical protein n=1 Tax=Octadecabacter sp. SW4 TaxID=2602067 RepID=UPI0011C1EAB3|nr:hypothetical protein [Octadecabacter sp. SW4]QEE34991.1 hypothetical protein FTO60_04245 [Octadecabacter sp. SW4]
MAMAENELYIHGYDLSDQWHDQDEDADEGIVDWDAEFQAKKTELETFLACRDIDIALGKTAHQCLTETLVFKNRYPTIELAALEAFQALFLTMPIHSSSVPTSPENFSKHWKALARLFQAFTKKQSNQLDQKDPIKVLTWRTKLQTIYYRFPFDQDICAEITADILGRIDSKGNVATDFASQFKMLIGISQLVAKRLHDFMSHIGQMMRAVSQDEAISHIEYFCSLSPTTNRMWERCKLKQRPLDDMKNLGYQLSELSTPWLFILEKDELIREFGSECVPLIKSLSLCPGELAGKNFEHFVMDNPVWDKPFIARPDGHFFLAIQYFPFSYPFRIIERLIDGKTDLLGAYSDARSEFLEDAIATTLKQTMPSAEIYRSVLWDDPDTGIRYENDVVAVVGNFIFAFEAKSGKISPAARRGAEMSLLKNIKSLFVEPWQQSQRLQRYLNEHGMTAKLWEKVGGRPVKIDLDKPKIAFSYSVCLEHLAALSSSKHFFLEAGLVSNNDIWAPVLSIGELFMLSKFLDSEVSFVHYLTRRFRIGEQFDFDGDEQDLLSMYLTNGFCLVGDAPPDKRIMFRDSDDAVRVDRTPNPERARAEIIGISLPQMWTKTVEEIYTSTVGTMRHRFDIICAILNQPPPSLLELQKRIRSWRRGGGGKEPRVSNYVVGSQQYVVATMFLNKPILSEDDLRNEARMHAMKISSNFEGMTDCAIFLYLKKSKQMTHDGVFFFRAGPQGHGKAALATPTRSFFS